jgi:hypothetical protein
LLSVFLRIGDFYGVVGSKMGDRGSVSPCVSPDCAFSALSWRGSGEKDIYIMYSNSRKRFMIGLVMGGFFFALWLNIPKMSGYMRSKSFDMQK